MVMLAMLFASIITRSALVKGMSVTCVQCQYLIYEDNRIIHEVAEVDRCIIFKCVAISDWWTVSKRGMQAWTRKRG